MSARPELQAVLFDLGDTLVDLGEGRGPYEERLVARTGRVYDVLDGRGLGLPTREEFSRALAHDSEARYHEALAAKRGITIFEVMRQFFRAHGLPEDEELIDAAGEAYCTGGALVPSALRTGALGVLETLKAWEVRMGAISNTVQPARFMSPMLVRRGLARFMTAQVYSSDCGVAKPDPAIFEFALRQLGVAAADAVYVGDRIVADVGGAQAAGMKGVLIEVKQRVETHPTIVPDARISELEELPAVLKQLFEVR